ncbi:MAG TPA: DUF2171 domain-containing protein [Gaiellaceae bacterium]|nr:DUF2171 domain-containing protein [Gaiellaceae bacterium]
MADPVSWLMIEPGWQVVDAQGEEVGRIEAVTGDSNADIFDGLSIASGMFARPKYVPAEQVAEITQGTVRLSLDRAGVDTLGAYDEPAESIDVEPDAASRRERMEESVLETDPRAHRVGLVRRLAEWLGLAGRR